VGFDYDIQFLSTGLSQITSEGPLRIAAGDANHSENLTLTTSGSGDVIVELTASSSTFMVTHAWDASNTIPFIINSETNSTSSVDVDASGVLFQIISDVDSDENVVFTIDAGGSYRYDMTGATPASDVAENYYVQDQTISGGDVVCLNGTPLTVEKCSGAYQSKLIGVISTRPALLMAVDFENARPVALNGRVPVKVSLENGSIEIGDPLTSASSTPGLAMKATSVGKILGYALESFEGSATSTDMILAFINLSERSGGDLTVYQNGDGQIEVKTLTTSGLTTIFSIDEEGVIVVGKLKVDEIEVKQGITIYDRVTQEPYCVYMAGGIMQTLLGKCSSTSTDATSTDAVCENGVNRPCGSEVGACQIGVQICEQGIWGECIGSVQPTTEICDEVDNDCDGETDEDGICGGAPEESTPEPPAEVCDGVDCGTISCDATLNLTGSCQNVCNGADGCSVCTLTCSCVEGFSECDGDPTNGCETASSTCPIL
jgi:hypothetical protein